MARMARWQKHIKILGALLLAYAGFDATREYGTAWQFMGTIVGAITGATIGFLFCVFLLSNRSDIE
jgi:ABC-type uncharacterized transport system permease subunit